LWPRKGLQVEGYLDWAAFRGSSVVPKARKGYSNARGAVVTIPTAIVDCLALLTAVLQGWIVYVMIDQKMRHRFPVFFFYTAFVALTGPVLVFVSWIFVWGRVSYTEYFYLYWAQEAVCSALRFLMIREVLRQLVAEYPALDKLGRNLVLGSVVLSLAISVAIVLYLPGDATSPIFGAVNTVDRTVLFVQSVVWVLVFALGWYFRLLWRGETFGLSLGFALVAAQRLLNATIYSYLGPTGVYSWRSHALNLAGSISYLSAVVVWLWYLRREEAVPAAAAIPAVNLERWNTELERLLQR